MKSDTVKHFTPAWNKAVSYGNAAEEFLCSCIFTYNGNGIALHKFLLSAAFEVGPLLLPCSLLDIRPLPVAGTLSISGPLPIGGTLTTVGSWNF
jgi:hypothetical protein